MNEKANEIIEFNKSQSDFYDNLHQIRQNFNPIMKLWLFFRRRMYYLMDNTTVWPDIYNLQKRWMGDLAGKKVLDFGCYQGNALSDFLATNSGSYYGIDLSGEALKRLSEHFVSKGIRNAKLECVDVLSNDFKEDGFDVIYAQGVLHHFNPIEVLLPILQKKLSPGGKIISLDPLQTTLLTITARKIYHPFRIDREWEWPFKKEIFEIIQKYFRIKSLQGIMGCSKWAIPLVFINRSMAIATAQKLHRKDMKMANDLNANLWGCLQVAMCMEK